MRPRTRKTLLWVVICAGVFVACAEVIPRLTASHKTSGHFDIATYTTFYFFGLPERHTSLTYSGSRLHVSVGRNVGHIHVDPYDPDRVLYEYCPDDVSPKCGTYYFDGHTRKRWKVTRARVLDQIMVDEQRVNEVHWSGNKRYAVLATYHQLHIVDLQADTSADIGKALDLPVRLVDVVGGRYVRYLGFSPDVRQVALVVGDYLDQSPPVAKVSEDIITVDLRDYSLTYVATAQPNGWYDDRLDWLQGDDGTYRMNPQPADARPDQTLYVKTADQLPPGMRQQGR